MKERSARVVRSTSIRQIRPRSAPVVQVAQIAAEFPHDRAVAADRAAPVESDRGAVLGGQPQHERPDDLLVNSSAIN